MSKTTARRLHQKAARAIGLWLGRHKRSVLLAAITLYLASGIYYVPADQQAVKIRFGKYLPGQIHPGLHYSFPYPVDEVIRLKMNEARRLSIGGDDLSRTLGVVDQKTDHHLITADQNLVRMRAWIQYYIGEPSQFLYRAEDLTALLESIFLRSVTLAASTTEVDDILTTGRIALQNEILKTMQAEAEELKLGVVIAAVALEEVQAPQEVRDAFLEVADAREDRNRIVQEAIGYSNELLPRVRGRAQQMLEKASIYRTESLNRAEGEAERFRQVWEEYRRHRSVTKARLLLETIDDILPRIRKVIVDDKGTEEGLDLDIFRVQPQ